MPERAACGPGDPDMYLIYPPLSGKHLRLSAVAGPPGDEYTVSVAALGLTLFSVLRAHPPDCRDEEGSALPARRTGSGEGENATRLPGVYRCRSRGTCVVHAHFWD